MTAASAFTCSLGWPLPIAPVVATAPIVTALTIPRRTAYFVFLDAKTDDES